MRSGFSNQDEVSEQRTTGWRPGRGSLAVARFIAPAYTSACHIFVSS